MERMATLRLQQPAPAKPRRLGGARARSLAPHAAAPAWAAPPADWDATAACAAAGAALSARHPQLAPLLASGLLLALPRPAAYRERRSDGYEEPREVLLLGTAHLSQRSADNVSLVVAALAPDVVAVELCRSRAGALEAAPPLALSGDGSVAGFAAALARTLRLGGGPALLLRAALARWLAGAGAGAEFVAARGAARACGARLVLADRPIEVSLRRALLLSSGAERAAAAAGLAAAALAALAGGGAGGAAAVADAADAALAGGAGGVARLLEGPLARFPGAAAALLHERDAYLAWSCSRSKAVNGARMVVCVVGAGHLRGVAWALQEGQRERLRFDALSGKEWERGEREAQPPLWRRLAVDAVLGGAAWAAWEAWSAAGHEL